MKSKTIQIYLFFLITFNLYAQDSISIGIPENDFSTHLKLYLLESRKSGCINGLVDIIQREKNGTILVIASSKVYFNSCEKPKINNLCTWCRDTKFENDIFIYNKAKFKKCVVDCLKEDKILLASYYLEKEKLLNAKKK
jgi:hypothetical protein